MLIAITRHALIAMALGACQELRRHECYPCSTSWRHFPVNLASILCGMLVTLEAGRDLRPHSPSSRDRPASNNILWPPNCCVLKASVHRAQAMY